MLLQKVKDFECLVKRQKALLLSILTEIHPGTTDDTEQRVVVAYPEGVVDIAVPKVEPRGNNATISRTVFDPNSNPSVFSADALLEHAKNAVDSVQGDMKVAEHRAGQFVQKVHKAAERLDSPRSADSSWPPIVLLDADGQATSLPVEFIWLQKGSGFTVQPTDYPPPPLVPTGHTYEVRANYVEHNGNRVPVGVQLTGMRRDIEDTTTPVTINVAIGATPEKLGAVELGEIRPPYSRPMPITVSTTGPDGADLDAGAAEQRKIAELLKRFDIPKQ